MWQVFRRFNKDECARTRERLSGYVDRRLDPEELARVEEHLRDCRGCRQELGSMRATVTLLHRLPQVMPSRSFAVAPVAPVQGRTALRALRFAAAGAVLLLMLTFAADWTGLLQRTHLSTGRYGLSHLDSWSTKGTEDGDSYWVVSGVKNTIDPESETPVKLVVPDGSDNVVTAVNYITAASSGVLYANMVSDADDVPRLALTECGEEDAGVGGDVEEFTVVPASDDERSRFAANGADSQSAFESIIERQNEDCLNMLSSDNTELYSFDLDSAHREVIVTREDDWLRPLEYGLIGLVVVLGGTAVALWLKQRRARTREAG